MSKRTHSPAESLAARMRAAGVHRIGGARELELRLGRALTKLERRAFNMAQHSTSLPVSTAKQHARLAERTADLADWKGPRAGGSKAAPWKRRVPTKGPKGERPDGHADVRGDHQPSGHHTWASALPSVPDKRRRWTDDPFIRKTGTPVVNRTPVREVPRTGPDGVPKK